MSMSSITITHDEKGECIRIFTRIVKAPEAEYYIVGQTIVFDPVRLIWKQAVKLLLEAMPSAPLEELGLYYKLILTRSNTRPTEYFTHIREGDWK